MFRFLRNLLGRTSHPFARTLFDGRGARSRTQSTQFISHLGTSGFRTRNRFKHDRSLRRRQFAATIGAWVAALLVAWVVVESARALQIF